MDGVALNGCGHNRGSLPWSRSSSFEVEHHIRRPHDDAQSSTLGIISDPPSVYHISSEDGRDVFHLRVIVHNIYVQVVRVERDARITKYQKSTLYKTMYGPAQTATFSVALKLAKRDPEPSGIGRHQD